MGIQNSEAGVLLKLACTPKLLAQEIFKVCTRDFFKKFTTAMKKFTSKFRKKIILLNSLDMILTEDPFLKQKVSTGTLKSTELQFFRENFFDIHVKISPTRQSKCVIWSQGAHLRRFQIKFFFCLNVRDFTDGVGWRTSQ